MLVQIQKKYEFQIINKSGLYQNLSQQSAKPSFEKTPITPKTSGKDFASILASKI